MRIGLTILATPRCKRLIETQAFFSRKNAIYFPVALPYAQRFVYTRGGIPFGRNELEISIALTQSSLTRSL